MRLFSFAIVAFILLFLFGSESAHAQFATVVSSCPTTRANPYTIGTLAYPTVDVNGTFCTNAAGGGGGGSVTQGTSPWIDNICQAGATTPCAQVKAGNTAAAGDNALVVADPNLLAAATSPIPAGTNVIGGVTFPVNVGVTDCSGTVTTGGTAQNAFAAGATKHGFFIMNLSSDPMWINFTGAAVVGGSGSFLLPAGSSTIAGGSFTAPPGFGMNTALSVIAATTSDAFTCKWY